MLTERGLEPALQALVSRAPVPVSVEAEVSDRLPAPVESAAYFAVSEGLADVAKYANASRPASPSAARTATSPSTSPTTASVAPTPPTAPACEDWPTASRHSTARSRSTARPAVALRAKIPLA